MIKVVIKTNGVQSHFAHFENQQEADAWIQDCVEGNYWGKKAGFYPISKLSEEELTQEISRKEVDELGNSLMDVLIEIPDQYIVETQDITAQVEEEELKAKSKLAIELGANILSEIRYINVKKNMDITTFQSLMADNLLAAIERHIWTGSFLTAKGMILNYSGSHYNQDDKNYIIALLDDAIAKTV